MAPSVTDCFGNKQYCLAVLDPLASGMTLRAAEEWYPNMIPVEIKNDKKKMKAASQSWATHTGKRTRKGKDDDDGAKRRAKAKAKYQNYAKLCLKKWEEEEQEKAAAEESKENEEDDGPAMAVAAADASKADASTKDEALTVGANDGLMKTLVDTMAGQQKIQAEFQTAQAEFQTAQAEFQTAQKKTDAQLASLLAKHDTRLGEHDRRLDGHDQLINENKEDIATVKKATRATQNEVAEQGDRLGQLELAFEAYRTPAKPSSREARAVTDTSFIATPDKAIISHVVPPTSVKKMEDTLARPAPSTTSSSARGIGEGTPATLGSNFQEMTGVIDSGISMERVSSTSSYRTCNSDGSMDAAEEDVDAEEDKETDKKQPHARAVLSAAPLQQKSAPKLEPTSPMDTYEISDREESDTDLSDDDSEDDAPKKKIPEWAQKANLVPALERQFMDGPGRLDPDEIFPEVSTCNLELIFDQKKSRYEKRTSSGNWTKDRVTAAEKLVYKRSMGFQN